MPIPYRLAAVDLDQTLLGPDRRISPPNRAAVERLASLGVRVVLASGRRFDNMLRFHHALGLQGPIVSCQGALVRDVDSGETLHETLMPMDLALDVLDFARTTGIAAVYYGREQNFTLERTGWIEFYESRLLGRIEIRDPRSLMPDRPLKILLVDAPDRIARNVAVFQQRYAGRLHVVNTDPEYLELMPLGVNKGAALERLAARMGLQAAEVLAFGDGNNDVEMLSWAGVGIAMSHATPAALSAARFTAPPGPEDTSFSRGVELLLDRVLQRSGIAS